MRLRPRALPPLLALLLAGCGSGPSEDASRRAVDRFQDEVAAGDAAAACAQLTEHLRTTLEQDEDKPCPEALSGLGLEGGGRASRSRVYINSALVEVRGGENAFLDETPDGWRISAAGCTRSGDRYDCLLED
jgi:hypothetical protein